MKFSRLKQQMILDWRLATRHQILLTTLLLGLFLAVVLRFFFPSGERLIETFLGISVVISSTSIFLGSSFVWIPRLSGVLSALKTTPLRPLEFLLAKGVVLVGLYGLFAGLVLLISNGIQPVNPELYPGVLSLGWVQGYLGLWIGIRQKTISRFAAQALGLIVLFQVPLLVLMLGWTQSIWHLFPGYSSLAWAMGRAELVDYFFILFWSFIPIALCLQSLKPWVVDE